MLSAKAAQLVAREAILHGPQGLFARLISSWKGLPLSGKKNRSKVGLRHQRGSSSFF